MTGIARFIVVMFAISTVGMTPAVASAIGYNRSLDKIQKDAERPVSHEELARFVSVIKEVNPIDIKAHALGNDNQLSGTEKRRALTRYEGEIKSVVLQNNLTPLQYAALLR
ncbi:hypothetical protein AB4090_14945, partial [Acidithiobacillus sp. IBUN Pt1247-S3]|uniref:hypothetical protein n=1 Tax=Acidithiobacillus sp. IBUN Pt1247-S3 TaxID=3166642 RepID=UPI0034E38863